MGFENQRQFDVKRGSLGMEDTPEKGNIWWKFVNVCVLLSVLETTLSGSNA